MKKKIMKMIGAALLSALVALSGSCSKQRDYGTEYNYKTDCQYSYYNRVSYWKKIQSDCNGQYILKNRYIYYYNIGTKKMTPLCNKANCLHDIETDQNRQSDCNAYAPTEFAGGVEYIQYYDGYIYYTGDDSLYRVRKDGSQKDKIFSTDNGMRIDNWLIHRGCFYYAFQTYYYGEDKSTQVYTKFSLKSVELSSNMSEKDAKLVFESDGEHSVHGLYSLKAYKNYLCYEIIANVNDYEVTTTESWYQQLYQPMYIYNIETEENSIIPIPEGFSEITMIRNVVFLKDKMLLDLYDNSQDKEYQLPIYSIKYDLTDEKIWLDNVEQAKWVQSFDNYVILSDGSLHYEMALTDEGIYQDILKDSRPCINVEIYSADAERISYFVYPMNVSRNFNGFGPDGVNVEFEENDDSWSVYELNLDDVLHCNGEEVKLDLVSTRKYGTLNKD